MTLRLSISEPGGRQPPCRSEGEDAQAGCEAHLHSVSTESTAGPEWPRVPGHLLPPPPPQHPPVGFPGWGPVLHKCWELSWEPPALGPLLTLLSGPSLQNS